MTYQAAVFDLDGLLLDTEKVCMQAFRDACEALSLPMLEDVYLGIIGCNAQGIERVIQTGYGADLDYPRLRNKWMSLYHPIIEQQEIPKKEGVVALLEWLTSQKIPIAVATSSHQKEASAKLKLSGLDNYVSSLSTGCEVTHGKPDPEIYLLAAQRLNIPPAHCLAFEDSSNGVRAAVAAGMQVHQVPDLVKPTDDIIALGHNIDDSLLNVLNHLQAAQK
ncbi:HAD family hydrolase [Psychromonas sp. PT13]|uniref:HAD family hydrolase n=1 Tax=Psychromonas sp. PT13 TaxID=3439547 RepID=UPI003EBC3294